MIRLGATATHPPPSNIMGMNLSRISRTFAYIDEAWQLINQRLDTGEVGDLGRVCHAVAETSTRIRCMPMWCPPLAAICRSTTRHIPSIPGRGRMRCLIATSSQSTTTSPCSRTPHFESHWEKGPSSKARPFTEFERVEKWNDVAGLAERWVVALSVAAAATTAMSPVTSKCTTCGHFKVHHLGWRFVTG